VSSDSAGSAIAVDPQVNNPESREQSAKLPQSMLSAEITAARYKNRNMMI
jgi:hypothetical protein